MKPVFYSRDRNTQNYERRSQKIYTRCPKIDIKVKNKNYTPPDP